MGLISSIRERFSLAARVVSAAVQQSGGGMIITTPEQLAEAMRNGNLSASGAAVTATTAMRVAAVYACVRIIAGAVANLPLQVKRRKDERTREDASDDPLWLLFHRKPNRWQTPSQFVRMMQASVLLRGNGYALKVPKFRGGYQELIPLHAERMQVEQLDDLSLRYHYTTKSGGRRTFGQAEIFHLAGMSLDGVRGVSPIEYARNTIGLSISMEQHGAILFKNGARVGGLLSHPNKLGDPAILKLKASLEEFREGGEQEGKNLILEEGMKYERMGLSMEDAQWLDSRKFSRSEIATFFGVPPHMIGDTEKSTSWGSGIEQQAIGFVAYTLEDHLTMWEQTILRDLIDEKDDKLYARFNRAALVRGDFKTRVDGYTKLVQWGLNNPNELRALEDQNPRKDGKGDIYYDPPNTAGGQAETEIEPGNRDEPEKTSES